jgi:hypothetical protein
MRAAKVNINDWERQALDRTTWRTAVRERVKLSEGPRVEELKKGASQKKKGTKHCYNYN